MTRTGGAIKDERGSVALAFALCMAALVAGIGAALDYARLSAARTSLQSALDSALLMGGKDVLATGRRADRATIVREMQSNLPSDLQPYANQVEIEQTESKLSGRVTASLTNRFGAFLGIERSLIAAAASIPLGSTRLEVALVLDSTGSMGQLGKMDALKQSAIALIDTLYASRPPGTEIAVGVVPFATQVRLDPAYAGASWLDFRSAQAIPAENAAAATWDGCVMDRDKPFNRKRDLPTAGRPEEAYPAQNCTYAGLQRILPLTTDMSQVKSRIASLTPDGNTNTTIGMAWGYNVLNPAAPQGGGAAPTVRKAIRVMVYLTDGLNTSDRYAQTPAQMDSDMRNLCRDSRNADVRVFTIRVIEGNDDLLRDCASDPADFYTTNDAAGLMAVFKSIAVKLATLRLAS